ncbi:MAG: urate oxidase [Chloroflexota bacterium]|nr:urate oxidase [Chloroflexota bacterium]
MTRQTIGAINALAEDDAVELLGGLFEHSPWIVRDTWPRAPFASVERLHAALCETLRSAPRDRQIALIGAHPDLVGRAALAGTLTRESTAEQQAAGLGPDDLTADDIERFTRSNAEYQARFGFPFVICARANRKASILAGFERRLGNDSDTERRTALAEIERIAWYRLADLVENDPEMDGARSWSSQMDSGYEISYGKMRVPVYRVFGQPLRGVMPVPESPFLGRDNILFAAEVDIEVFGTEFLPAYTVGDNSMVVATDSMKNIIIRQALDYAGSTIEGYLHAIGKHFIATYEQVHDIRLAVRELPFPAAIVPDGEGGFSESEVLFVGSGRSDYGTTRMWMKRIGDAPTLVGHESGRCGIKLFKVTGSAFTSFVRDEYTTLPDRRDRPLFIYLEVHWTYGDSQDALGDKPHRYVPAEQVHDICAAVFHEFVSESIQHLVHEMGNRLLERFPQLVEVRFVSQNRTRDPFYASDDNPEVKVYSDPFPAYGEITLRLTRNGQPASKGDAWDS